MQNDLYIEAVGGSSIKNTGATIYESIDKLNVAGVVEIIKHMRRILCFLKTLVSYIVEKKFQEVILVDFPGFNLRLAKRLKKANPAIKITYVAPPQLWAWGQWRVNGLKKYCDKLVVLFPFEVDFYKQHGLKAIFLGHPSCDRLGCYFDQMDIDKNLIAILPGSRISEIEDLFGVFADVIKKFKRLFPKTKFVLLLAESFSKKILESKIKKFGLCDWGSDVLIVQGETEKLQMLSKCCMAITKPGTVTLELALLGIPAVVFYKASWITYILARCVVNIRYMSLPNLLLNNVVYQECIQSDCKSKIIFVRAKKLYVNVLENNVECKRIKKKLVFIRTMLCSSKNID
jgi:lipid-A-disaccharide synthase